MMRRRGRRIPGILIVAAVAVPVLAAAGEGLAAAGGAAAIGAAGSAVWAGAGVLARGAVTLSTSAAASATSAYRAAWVSGLVFTAANPRTTACATTAVNAVVTAPGQQAPIDLGMLMPPVGGLGGAPGLTEAENTLAGSIRRINDVGGKVNCVSCAIATDSTLAGRAASAIPGGPFQMPAAMANYAPGSVGLPVTGPSGINTIMQGWGPGARGIIWGTRGADVGHAFNVVNQNGVIRFLDGQSGGQASTTANYAAYFLFRTDKAGNGTSQ
jgi:hypothetical protein